MAASSSGLTYPVQLLPLLLFSGRIWLEWKIV